MKFYYLYDYNKNGFHIKINLCNLFKSHKKIYILIDAIILIYIIRVKIFYIKINLQNLYKLYKIIYVNNLHINLLNLINLYN